MKKYLILLLVLLLSISLVACQSDTQPPSEDNTEKVESSEAEDSSQTTETQQTEEETTSESMYPLTFTDSVGKEITLEKPIEKIVILNRQTAEAIKILQADDLVVAVGDTTHKNMTYLGYNDLPDLGKPTEVNLEKLIELKADVVFLHTNRAMELDEKLEPAGIKVIRMDNYQPEKYNEEMLLLGKILGKEKRAQEFLDYRDNLEKSVADIVATIDEESKPSVVALSFGFLKSQGGYRIFPAFSNDDTPGVGEGYSTLLAGGKDGAPEIKYDKAEASTTVMVDAEYVFEKQPDVITLHGTFVGGYEDPDTTAFKETLDEAYANSDLGELQAGKDKRVYCFNTDMLGAAKRPIGLIQLGKYLHPELFKDMDPIAEANKYFETWLGTEFKGTWWYGEE